MIRIAYFGLPLGALLLSSDGFEPEFAVLSPVRAPGARRLARRLGDRVIHASTMTKTALEHAVDERFESLDIDLVVSWFWTRLLPKRWLDAPRFGAIGAHPSLLPRHRGPDPFFWAIDCGDEVTGVSIHFLTQGYDQGAVIRTESLAVGDRNAWELARALDRPSLRLLRLAVSDFANSGAPPSAVPQNEALATWAPEPMEEFLRVDWHAGTDRVLRRIRALSPVPGLPLEIQGVRFTALRAEVATAFPVALAPGEAALTEAGVVIRTGDGAIRVTRATMDEDEGEEESPLRETDAVGLRETVGSAAKRRRSR